VIPRLVEDISLNGSAAYLQALALHGQEYFYALAIFIVARELCLDSNSGYCKVPQLFHRPSTLEKGKEK
jgi:hypothetical protein